jgi:NAD(P)-dependent dehydrogenase (short-subunit alcohol dehydrogenase family)
MFLRAALPGEPVCDFCFIPGHAAAQCRLYDPAFIQAYGDYNIGVFDLAMEPLPYQELLMAHAKAYGGLDIAFANAGIDTGAGFWNPAGHRNPEGQVDAYDPKRWDKSISVNLSGVFYTVSNAVRIMKQPGRANGRSGGSIICTASNAGLVTEPIVGLPYMPAKAGVLHMVRALGLELAEFRIRINAIAPGPFVTNIGGGWLKKDPVARKAWDAIVPLGAVAETDQLKPLALLLASDASDYMTGSHVVIDGGMMLGKFQ